MKKSIAKIVYFILFSLHTVSPFAQILINNGAISNITTGTFATAGSLENTTGTITNSGTLTLSGNLTNSSTGNLTGNGTYKIGDDWSNTGTFNEGTSTVNFNGSTAQTIGGSESDFYNLTIDNSSGGVSLAANENLYGTLTLTNGMFTTTGFNFILISNATATARIAQITGGDITGNITIQRYISGNDGWRTLSSPVAYVSAGKGDFDDWENEFKMSGFPGTDYSSASFQSVKYYDETNLGGKNEGYSAPASASTGLTSGQGYMCWLGNDPAPGTSPPKIIDLTGTPNKSGVSLPITFSSTGVPANDGWNLVGNPYPSSIDFDALPWPISNMDSYFYIWNDADGHQHYEGWMNGLGALSDAGSNIISSMQGFWVKANATPASITLSESHKSSTDQPLFKQIPDSQIVLKLIITAQNGYSDQTTIRFISGATEDYEGNMDAYKFFSGSSLPPQISTVIGDSTDLALNSLPDLINDRVIKVRTKSKTAGYFSIAITGIEKVPADFCLLLRDKLTGTVTDFKLDTVYEFTMSDTTFYPRFFLHLLKNDSVSCSQHAAALTEINSPPFPISENIVFTLKNKLLTVFPESPNPKGSFLNIYNLLGEKIISEKRLTQNKSPLIIDLSNNPDGIYLLSVYVSNHIITRKIFLGP